MPIAFLKDPESHVNGQLTKSPSVEIWKFGLYLWCEEQLRVTLVLILNNAPTSPADFDRLRIVFPYVLAAGSVNEKSALLENESYPLNNFKFGPYQKVAGKNFIDLYDGIPNVKILKAAGDSVKPATTYKEPERSLLDLDFSGSALKPGETGGLLLTFQLPPSTINGTVVAPHGLTYRKTNTSLEFSIRIFDRHFMAGAADDPKISDDEIIQAKVLYDKVNRYGGFDINIFVPTAYIDAKTSPDAEYLDVVAYDCDGQPSREKYTRFVWRARRLYEGRDLVKCGDRMVLSGVFLNPNEVLSQLQTVSNDLKQEIGQVKTLSANLQKTIEKVDWWGKVAIFISAVGLFALVLEYDKIVSIFRDFLLLIKSRF